MKKYKVLRFPYGLKEEDRKQIEELLNEDYDYYKSIEYGSLIIIFKERKNDTFN